MLYGFNFIYELTSESLTLIMFRYFTIDYAETIFQFAKTFGFAPFSVVDGKSVTKPIDLFCFLTNLTIATSILSLTIIYTEELKTGKSVLIDAGLAVTFVGSLFIVVTADSLTFFSRHEIWKIVLKLRKVDEIFRQNHFEGDCRKFKVVYGTVMAIFISLAPLLSLSIYKGHGSFMKALVYSYAGFYYVSLNQMTAIFISSIYVRLSSINKILKLSYVNQTKALSHANVYKSLIEVYSDLMDAFDKVNALYGILMMLGMSLTFFLAIFTLFMTYKDIAEETFDGITVTSILFIIYLMLFTVATINSTILSEFEAQNARQNCRQIIKRSTDPAEIEMVVALSSSIARRPPKFSCGLFDFDLKLAYGESKTCRIIGSIINFFFFIR